MSGATYHVGGKTGATTEQIEAAIQRTLDDLLGYEFGELPNTRVRTREVIERWASRLVPEGYVIVPAAAGLGEEARTRLREAIATKVCRFNGCELPIPKDYACTDAILAILEGQSRG